MKSHLTEAHLCEALTSVSDKPEVATFLFKYLDHNLDKVGFTELTEILKVARCVPVGGGKVVLLSEACRASHQ